MHDATATATACCSGHGASIGMAVGLPNNSRTAAASVEIGMRHMEQSMRAVESLGLDKQGKMELLAIVDDFVFGHALRMSESMVAAIADPRTARSITKFTKAQIATGDFPLIAALLGEEDPIEAFYRIAKWLADEDRFDVGLETILDGFEARLARKKKR